MGGVERELLDEIEGLKGVVHGCRIAELAAKHEAGELRERVVELERKLGEMERKLKWERDMTRLLKVRAGWLRDKEKMARDIADSTGKDWRFVTQDELLRLEVGGGKRKAK